MEWREAMMKDTEIAALVGTLRSLGVTRYRCEGLELELGPVPQAPAAPVTPAEVAELAGPMPTEEDMRFWSVSGPLPSELKPTGSPQE